MAILVISTIVHYYAVGFLTAITALKHLDSSFEDVSASLSITFYTTAWRVTIPMCLPTLLEMGMFYFIKAMTTITAVVFLYPPSIHLASVSVMKMDEAGDLAPAAAMCIFIISTCVIVRILFGLAIWGLERRAQRWKRVAL